MKLSFGFSKKAEPKRVVPALATKPKVEALPRRSRDQVDFLAEDEGREVITSLEGGEVKIDGASASECYGCDYDLEI